MNVRRRSWIVIPIAVILFLATSCSISTNNGNASEATPSPLPTSTPAATATPIDSSNLFSIAIGDVVQQVRPAVVQITNQQTAFDQFNQPFSVPAGVGSGVIYDTEGHIITNDHVVEGAEKLLVTLPDGRSFTADLVGQDAQTDLAVLQIKGENLPVAALGDSSKLAIGDWVVAIGNALALPGGPTVTAGVVSATGRTVQEPADSSGQPGPFLFDVVQTDAAINPGNSGGPLVNLNGEVIAINTLVAGQAEPGIQAEGIGFAISIATVKPIADQLVATGHAVHPYLGIQYAPLNAAIAAQIGIDQTFGAYIGKVASGSPAEDAGLKAKDIITKIDGVELTEDSALAQILESHKPGDTVTLSVLRDKQALELTATLKEEPST